MPLATILKTHREGEIIMELYKSIEIEVVRFENADVITNSGDTNAPEVP